MKAQGTIMKTNLRQPLAVASHRKYCCASPIWKFDEFLKIILY